MNTYSAGLSLSDTLMDEDSGAGIMLFAYHDLHNTSYAMGLNFYSTLIVVHIFLQLHALVAHAQVNS